ncbi:MAG TPA: cupin domain-containing protein [Kofleriaceae bacterium]|nr:cupin domain-containing protein [Kofleriaceae bacterium]
MAEQPFELATVPAHLGLGARVHQLPTFSGMAWYQQYERDFASDGNEGRLVSLYTFDRSWDSWEMHPHGDELVVCTAGEIMLWQDLPAGAAAHTLRAGQAIVNRAGVWHTADVASAATVLFVTAGVGTQHRPRTHEKFTGFEK